MSQSITATYLSKMTFTLSDISGSETVSMVDSSNDSITYTYGSGNNQVQNGISASGQLAANGSYNLSTQALPQAVFGTGVNTISLSKVKCFTVANKSTTEGYDMVISATGSNSFTNLFNGGSGNILLKPGASFSYNDPFDGLTTGASQANLQLNDTGSGASYKIFMLGLE